MGSSLGSGLQAHGALAVTEAGLPLGVVGLEIWARDFPDQSLAKEERRKAQKSKPVAEKESRKWLDCMASVQASLPADLNLLFIQDREADMFELFEAPRRAGTELLVRAAQPRRVQVLSEEARDSEVVQAHLASPAGVSHVSTVFDAVRSSRVLGEVSVEVSATPTRKARTAVLEVRACPVLLCAPASRLASQGRTPRAVWLVSAREAEPPAEGLRVDWTLLSTIPAPTFEAACRLVTFYTCRWLIERLHFVLKSGLKVEELRLDDAHSLKNALALHYMVAWRLMHLTYLARTEPEQPASQSLEPIELEVLSLMEGKALPTIAMAVTAIAKLGGYSVTPRAGPPGLKVLWQGLRRLEAIVEGYLLAHNHPKEVNH
jgi:hypothetical protein